MHYYRGIPYQLEIPAALGLAFFEAAAASARAAAWIAFPEKPRRSVGRTLRPGPNTPLWCELVKQARPHLRGYGEKAKLARILGLPRQRIQDCIKARTACLDAERTLLLLCWVAQRQQGRDLPR